MRKFIECPAEDYTCPYCDANAHCMMYPDSDPYEECDTFYYYCEEEFHLDQDEMEELEEALYQEAEREKQNLLERKQSKDLEEDWREV